METRLENESTGDLQTKARAAIGAQADDDYVLDPTRHADAYAASAPDLAAVLGSARLTTIARQYKQRDEDAGTAQADYKRTIGWANLAVFATAVLSAGMMAFQIFVGTSQYGSWIVGGLGMLSGACGALAAMWLYQIRQGKLLERWMTARARAETARLSYFTALAELGEAAPDPAFDLLKLEYFRRYQYDVQANFYRNRGRQHDKAAQKNLRLGSTAVLFSAAAAGTSGVVGLTTGGAATALGALGVLGAALASYAAARENTSQDQRNAERYGRTQEALENIGGERLDRVRSAVAQGNAQALAEFVAAVNEQISLEHRQWLEGSEATKAAVAKLEETLKSGSGPKK
jgi:hypothetical protein